LIPKPFGLDEKEEEEEKEEERRRRRRRRREKEDVLDEALHTLRAVGYTGESSFSKIKL
jgi:hypothetical protein